MRSIRHVGRWLAALGLPAFVIPAVALVGFAGGCQSRMHDENIALHEQNRQLQQQLDRDRNRAGETEEANPAAMQSVAMQPAPAAQPAPQVQQPSPQPPARTATPVPPQIEGTETTTDVVAGTMTVRVPGDVVFDPGKAMIREQARTTLDKIAAALKKDYSGKQIRVEGHTDADPIKVSKWKSNQELSEARAAAVKAYLVQKGVSATAVTTHGFGSDKPKGADKALNRRVEIVVVTR